MDHLTFGFEVYDGFVQLWDRLEALDDSVQVAGVAQVLDAHRQLQLNKGEEDEIATASPTFTSVNKQTSSMVLMSDSVIAQLLRLHTGMI